VQHLLARLPQLVPEVDVAGGDEGVDAGPVEWAWRALSGRRLPAAPPSGEPTQETRA